jgi:glycosyltransferase involved in cell wall biosynthesis
MGGVERFLDSVISSHDADIVRPVVLSFSSGDWIEDLAERGIRTYCLEHVRLRHPLRSFSEISRILADEEIDIVHSSYAWCHALTSPAAIKSHCRQVWFHHGPIGPSRWQGVMPLVPTDLLLSNSYYLQERIKRTFYLSRKCDVVHYGINPESVAPDQSLRKRFRKENELDDNVVAIGLIGFIDTWKGQDIFLQAAERLKGSNMALRFFIIGGPRSGAVAERCRAFEEQLKRFIQKNALTHSVLMTGHLDVMAGALDGLDIVVHASTEPEPFGMVILEAMAKSKAIIASKEGGPREVIRDGIDGWLIEPRKPELLAESIRRLASGERVRDELGQCARAGVIARFHAAEATKKLEEWYQILKPHCH